MNKRRRFKAKRLRKRCERCGRRIRDHRPFNLNAYLRRSAKSLAEVIDAQAADHVYGDLFGGHEIPNATGHTMTVTVRPEGSFTP